MLYRQILVNLLEISECFFTFFYARLKQVRNSYVISLRLTSINIVFIDCCGTILENKLLKGAILICRSAR